MIFIDVNSWVSQMFDELAHDANPCINTSTRSISCSDPAILSTMMGTSPSQMLTRQRKRATHKRRNPLGFQWDYAFLLYSNYKYYYESVIFITIISPAGAHCPSRRLPIPLCLSLAFHHFIVSYPGAHFGSYYLSAGKPRLGKLPRISDPEIALGDADIQFAFE